MASLYKQTKSPFWWIKCRDARSGSPTFGKRIRFSTGLRIGVGADTRAARQLCAERTLAESKIGAVSSDEHWSVWVTDFLKVHCRNGGTLIRYGSIWRNLALFLSEKCILAPRQLTRQHCLAYMAWRLKPDRSIGKYRAIHNTAHTELRILSLVMSEAVRRDFATFNPVRDLGIPRHRPKEKPEFTDQDLAFIWNAIQNEPANKRQFLANSFLIARYQGCRLNETCLNPLADVDIAQDNSGIIRFRIKGGREHTAPLHPELVALFQELKKNGLAVTYQKPRNPSRTWFDFLKRIGVSKKILGACFHSLRVTAITRLARDKRIKESTAMRFIGHSSTTVHRIYQRLRVEDMGDCLDALGKNRESGNSGASEEKP